MRQRKNIQPICIEGDVAYMPLTRGYVAIIDAADVPLVSGYKWSAAIRGRLVYAQASIRRADGSRTVMHLHRLIMDPPSGMHVDHRNGDGLDSRRSNMRLATHQQNQINKGLTRQNRSGFKGVSWSKRAGKYQASIKHNGRSKHLGLFDTREKAHAAYCVAAAEYHGAFGRTE